MKLRNPWLIRSVAFLASLLVRLWISTLHYRIVLLPGAGEHPANPRRQRFLYAFWHETLLFPTVFRQPVQALISQHSDGELITQVCQHLGFGVVRGSTTRGGIQALLQLCRAGGAAHLMVTPDGPRGPRRRVQPGLLFVASRTGLAIVCCGVGYSWAWRAHSWDRFAVPVPFSEAVAVVGPPIAVPPHLDRRELEEYRQRVEERFLAVTDAAERLAERRPVPEPAPSPVPELPWKASA